MWCSGRLLGPIFCKPDGTTVPRKGAVCCAKAQSGGKPPHSKRDALPTGHRDAFRPPAAGRRAPTNWLLRLVGPDLQGLAGLVAS